MTAVEMLSSDVKHCRLDEAEKLCDYFAEEVGRYIHEDESLDDEFREIAFDCQPDILGDAEFLWHNHWDSFIDYMRAKYLD